MLLMQKMGKLNPSTVFFQKVGNPNIKPAIDEQTALNKALAWINAKKYGWKDPFTENLYKEQKRDSSATLKPKGELLIILDDSITHTYRLAYKINIYAVTPLVDKNVYIDAISGNIIGTENLIQDANTLGTAATLYSRTQNVTMDSYSSPIKYRLQETRTTNGKTAQIQTYNMQNGGNYTDVDFSNSSINWTTADAGLDVHWGTEKVFDYWSTVRNRNSFDNNGATIKNYVHYSTGYDNAFWSGTMHVMTYGDGTQFNPLVALDIIAHEIGHGICQYTANLNNGASSYNEQSALNEGLSDIWATCVKYWAAPNKPTWLMGGEILRNSSYNCIRDMQNPKSTSAAEGQHPNTYKGAYWSSAGEPHYNSTVLSHWFYLLSQGGSGTIDDKGVNAYNITGIGIDKAANIVWDAESTGKLLSQSQYADARTAMISAATDLYGNCSTETISVTNAWYAVGVGSQFISTSVNFTNQIVTTNTTVTSCGDINVQNVKVQNGAKLILDAAGEVNIISDFDVELGSEFEIVNH